MLHISVITSPDTYNDESAETFLKLSMETVQVHLIIGTTLVHVLLKIKEILKMKQKGFVLLLMK